MRLSAVLISGGLLALLSSPLAQAQSVLVPTPGPSCLPGTPSGTYPTPIPSTPGTTPSTQPGTTPSTQPGQQPQVPMPQGADAAAGAGLGAAAAAGASGTSGREGQAQMMGDLGLGGYTTVITGRLTPFVASTSSFTSGSFTFTTRNFVDGYGPGAVQQVPNSVRGGSAFKISDNESPAPVDRVFATYNYFGLRSPDGTTGTLHREVAGFEKTFLDGMGSIGLRVPVFQTSGFNGVDQSDIGDLSVIAKLALLNDRESGSLLSVGAVVTVPTGPNTTINQFTAARDVTGTTFLVPGNTFNLNSTLISPYVGWIVNLDSFYLQGFSSAIIPTDTRDVRLLSNSVGLNYRAFQSSDEGSLVSSLIPAIEAHVTTPLNHRGSNSFDGLGFPDIVVLTGGVHIGLANHARLTFGAATSVTGPRAYDVEGIAQLNFIW